MNNETFLLVETLEKDLGLALSPSLSLEAIRSELVEHINHLINTDFEKLVFILYRIDVNENKMKKLLEQKQGENAAGLITDLIIERQLEKIESRKKFKQDNDPGEEESW